MFTGVAAIWIIGIIVLGVVGVILRYVILAFWEIHENKDDLKNAVKKTKGIQLKSLEQSDMSWEYRARRLGGAEDNSAEAGIENSYAFEIWQSDTTSPTMKHPYMFNPDIFKEIAMRVYDSVYTDESREYEKYIIFALLSNKNLYTRFLQEVEVAEAWQKENKRVYSCNDYLRVFISKYIHPQICKMLEENIPCPDDFRHMRPGTTSESGKRFVAVNIGKYCNEEYIPIQEHSEMGTALGAMGLAVLVVLCLIGAISSGSLFSPLGFIATALCFVTAGFVIRRQNIAGRALSKVFKQEGVSYDIISSLNLYNSDAAPYKNEEYMTYFDWGNTRDKIRDLTQEICFSWTTSDDFNQQLDKLLPKTKKMLSYFIERSNNEVRNDASDDCVTISYNKAETVLDKLKSIVYNIKGEFREWMIEERLSKIGGIKYGNRWAYETAVENVEEFQSYRRAYRKYRAILDEIKAKFDSGGLDNNNIKEITKNCKELEKEIYGEYTLASKRYCCFKNE